MTNRPTGMVVQVLLRLEATLELPLDFHLEIIKIQAPLAVFLVTTQQLSLPSERRRVNREVCLEVPIRTPEVVCSETQRSPPSVPRLLRLTPGSHSVPTINSSQLHCSVLPLPNLLAPACLATRGNPVVEDYLATQTLQLITLAEASLEVRILAEVVACSVTRHQGSELRHQQPAQDCSELRNPLQIPEEVCSGGSEIQTTLTQVRHCSETQRPTNLRSVPRTPEAACLETPTKTKLAPVYFQVSETPTPLLVNQAG